MWSHFQINALTNTVVNLSLTYFFFCLIRYSFFRLSCGCVYKSTISYNYDTITQCCSAQEPIPLPDVRRPLAQPPCQHAVNPEE